MSLFVRGVCKSCHAIIHVSIDGKSLDEVREGLARLAGYECPGQHVEFTNALEAFLWDWVPVDREEAPSDEQYARALIAAYGAGNVFQLGNDGLGRELGLRSLGSVAGLQHEGFGRFTAGAQVYERFDSPSGTRFFVKRATQQTA